MPNKPYKNIAGLRFGFLIALERITVPETRKHGTTLWKFKCDCGKEVVTSLSKVQSGNTKSCGCLHVESARARLKKLRGPCRCSSLEISKKFTYYKRNAKRRHHEWNLTPMDFEQMISDHCFYCGATSRVGLDRVDCQKAYDFSNVVACCTSCNQAKNNKTVNEFAAWVEKTYNFLFLNRWNLDPYVSKKDSNGNVVL